MATIDAQQLGKRVQAPSGELALLTDVSLQVQSGEAVAVVGPSGSGKSTLLALLAGLDRASSGSLHLLGQRLDELDEEQRAALRAGKVGFVFQSFQLMEGLSALENVQLPLELAELEDPEARARELLDEVGLGERLDHLPQRLSGGEQQRVALARAFALRPQVLFADEPTGNLDPVTGERVIELMFSLRERFGTTLLLVTHDLDLAARCDRCLRMEGGRLSVSADSEQNSDGAAA